MKAETFLANLHARAKREGGLNLSVLARHLAEAIEEISEPKNATPKLSGKKSTKKSAGKE